jgi:cyclic dehypoxanthinyl futalosine synthase
MVPTTSTCPIEDEVTQKAGATISLNFDRILNVARSLGFEPTYRHVAVQHSATIG